MARLYKGRFTATLTKPYVVFLIGMRVNKWWAVHRWLPVALQMPKMVRSLEKTPALGCLHTQSFGSFPASIMIQYWENWDKLESFARDPDQPHAAAWQKFFRKMAATDAVGLWHEAYEVKPGAIESLYINMPKFGAGAALGSVEVRGWMDSARGRKGSKVAG